MIHTRLGQGVSCVTSAEHRNRVRVTERYPDVSDDPPSTRRAGVTR